MDSVFAFLMALEPQHWFVLGLVLLIAELASGTTYLLWPATAAFIVGLVTMTGATTWALDVGLFAALVIVLTLVGRPAVQRLRAEGAPLNERGAQMVGARGVVTAFANGAGSVKIGDTIWRAVSEEALAPGENVEIASVDGVTLTVRRAL